MLLFRAGDTNQAGSGLRSPSWPAHAAAMSQDSGVDRHIFERHAQACVHGTDTASGVRSKASVLPVLVMLTSTSELNDSNGVKCCFAAIMFPVAL